MFQKNMTRVQIIMMARLMYIVQIYPFEVVRRKRKMPTLNLMNIMFKTYVAVARA